MEEQLLEKIKTNFEVDEKNKIILVNFDEQDIPTELEDLVRNFGYIAQYQIY